MEAIQHEIPLLIPSLAFLKSLVFQHWYAFTSKDYITPEMLSMCEHYQEDKDECYIFFDSFEEIPRIVESLNGEEYRLVLKQKRNVLHDAIIAKWKKVLEVDSDFNK